jgi:small subunit ribosomal protein S18
MREVAVSERSSYRQRFQRPKFCAFCVDKEAQIEYKRPETLRRYVFGSGKIRPRRQTGICAKHQRALAKAVKRARHIALVGFTSGYRRG